MNKIYIGLLISFIIIFVVSFIILIYHISFYQPRNVYIPRNVYMTWHTKTLPTKMRENYETVKTDNPEFKFNLFDENDCKKFIKGNFEKEVLDAYNSLIPRAYKIDLWRYCILYIHGGIYMDIKFKCINGFKLITLTNKEHFVKEHGNCVYNGVIICGTKSNVMKSCIYQIVQNVKNKYYGNGKLDPTGPCLLGKQFSPFQLYDLKLLYTGKFTILDKGNAIIQSYDEYENEKSYNNTTNKGYTQLWDEKKIYV